MRWVQLYSSLDIFWHCLSLGLEWKQLTFFSPVATAGFSKFAGILSEALSQHHLLGFEKAQLEFHYLYITVQKHQFFGIQPSLQSSSHIYEIKRCLLLGRKAMTNLDGILKCRDITLLTKVHLVKALMPGCSPGGSREFEGWTALACEKLIYWLI